MPALTGSPDTDAMQGLSRHLKLRYLFLWVVVGVACLSHGSGCADDETSSAEQSATFRRDVLPILADKCFACHGADADAREAELRLDTFDGAISDANGQAAIVPNNLDESELWLRINSDDHSYRMPPPEAHAKLSLDEQAAIREWIEAGAIYEPHWAFVEPQRPSLPKEVRDEWCRNPIDAFILRKILEAGMVPSTEANRETLIRRVTLDLTGLPPTSDEVEAFAQDSRSDAYEHLVSRLLATKASAEHRAKDWLDLARYADTRGFADDKMREIWPYRDWVVEAIACNMPFDQFTVEQLAGDMLPNATASQRLATAFHRNAPQARGETYPVEEYRIQGVVDRVNTTGQVWLGLTMGCAQCHDHKFDPVSQKDYFAMFALFNNIEHRGEGFEQGGPTMPYLEAAAELAQRRETILLELQQARQNSAPRLPPKQDPHQVAYRQSVSKPVSIHGTTVEGDLTIAARIKTSEPIGDIVSQYDWRAGQRGFVFGIGGEGEPNSNPGHLFAWISSSRDPFQGIEIHGSIPVNNGTAHDVALVFEAGKSIRLFVDGIEDLNANRIGEVPASIAVPDRELVIGGGYRDHREPTAFQFVGDLHDVFVFSRTLEPNEGIASSSPEVLRAARRLNAFDERYLGQLKSLPSVPVMRELAKPRDTFVHVRGDFRRHGDRVEPAVPEFFASQEQPKTRLDFARWLVNGTNPLVARVVVNRYWQSYFGRGLVTTPDDFGVQGALPTHPELLDWLAEEFVESGWDMQRMHWLIVTSATYRQRTEIDSQHRRDDPENRLLARMPRIRLSAEQLRDQALLVSGLLVDETGGPAVFPQQPPNYWLQRALPGTWKVSTGEDRYRRTLYTYWRRMALHPSLDLLDAPPREICVTQRKTSNVPTQALVLLNDPMFFEAAQALASRIMNSTPPRETDRIRLLFQWVLGRQPTDMEASQFAAFLEAEERFLTRDSKEAIELVGRWKADRLSTHAAWVVVCSVVLNLDETMTRP